MKHLFASLAIASLALLTIAGSVAIAASSPAIDLGTLNPIVDAPAALTTDDVTSCQLLIVEDSNACVFTVVSSKSCAPEVVTALQRTGARLLTTNAFLAGCLMRPSASEAPS